MAAIILFWFERSCLRTFYLLSRICTTQVDAREPWHHPSINSHRLRRLSFSAADSVPGETQEGKAMISISEEYYSSESSSNMHVMTWFCNKKLFKQVLVGLVRGWRPWPFVLSNCQETTDEEQDRKDSQLDGKQGQSGEPVFLRMRETVVVTTTHVPVRLPWL